MTTVIVPIGPSQLIATSGTVAVANVRTNTNAFRITNIGTVDCYAGVFKTYAEAAAMGHPTAGNPQFSQPVNSNSDVVIAGNFGINPDPGTVYVATITAASTTNVVITPVAP